MSAQPEEMGDGEQGLLFEGFHVNAVTFSASISGLEVDVEELGFVPTLGDRIVADHVEFIINDVAHGGGKFRDVDNKTVGTGSIVRKLGGDFVKGTGTARSSQRRESEEDRIRRLTR